MHQNMKAQTVTAVAILAACALALAGIAYAWNAQSNTGSNTTDFEYEFVTLSLGLSDVPESIVVGLETFNTGSGISYRLTDDVDELIGKLTITTKEVSGDVDLSKIRLLITAPNTDFGYEYAVGDVETRYSLTSGAEFEIDYTSGITVSLYATAAKGTAVENVVGNTCTVPFTAVAKAGALPDDNVVTNNIVEKQNKITAEEIQQYVQAAQEDSTVTVKITNEIGASVILSSAALAKLDTTQEAELAIETVDTATLTQEQQEVVGDATVFDISLGDNHDFSNGNITLTIPYTLKDGETADNITVFALLDDGTLESHPCTYDAENRTVTFSTSHLSVYGVTTIAKVSQTILDKVDTMELVPGLAMSYVFTYEGNYLADLSNIIISSNNGSYEAIFVDGAYTFSDRADFLKPISMLGFAYSRNPGAYVVTEISRETIDYVSALFDSPIKAEKTILNVSHSPREYDIVEFTIYNGVLLKATEEGYWDDVMDSSQALELRSLVNVDRDIDLVWAGIPLSVGDKVVDGIHGFRTTEITSIGYGYYGYREKNGESGYQPVETYTHVNEQFVSNHCEYKGTKSFFVDGLGNVKVNVYDEGDGDLQYFYKGTLVGEYRVNEDRTNTGKLIRAGTTECDCGIHDLKANNGVMYYQFEYSGVKSPVYDTPVNEFNRDIWIQNMLDFGDPVWENYMQAHDIPAATVSTSQRYIETEYGLLGCEVVTLNGKGPAEITGDEVMGVLEYKNYELYFHCGVLVGEHGVIEFITEGRTVEQWGRILAEKPADSSDDGFTDDVELLFIPDGEEYENYKLGELRDVLHIDSFWDVEIGEELSRYLEFESSVGKFDYYGKTLDCLIYTATASKVADYDESIHGSFDGTVVFYHGYLIYVNYDCPDGHYGDHSLGNISIKYSNLVSLYSEEIHPEIVPGYAKIYEYQGMELRNIVLAREGNSVDALFLGEITKLSIDEFLSDISFILPEEAQWDKVYDCVLEKDATATFAGKELHIGDRITRVLWGGPDTYYYEVVAELGYGILEFYDSKERGNEYYTSSFMPLDFELDGYTILEERTESLTVPGLGTYDADVYTLEGDSGAFEGVAVYYIVNGSICKVVRINNDGTSDEWYHVVLTSAGSSESDKDSGVDSSSDNVLDDLIAMNSEFVYKINLYGSELTTFNFTPEEMNEEVLLEGLDPSDSAWQQYKKDNNIPDLSINRTTGKLDTIYGTLECQILEINGYTWATKSDGGPEYFSPDYRENYRCYFYRGMLVADIGTYHPNSQEEGYAWVGAIIGLAGKDNPGDNGDSDDDGEYVNTYILGDYVVYQDGCARLISIQLDDGEVYSGVDMASVLKAPLSFKSTMKVGVLETDGHTYYITWTYENGMYHYFDTDGDRREPVGSIDNVLYKMDMFLAEELLEIPGSKLTKGTYTYDGKSVETTIVQIPKSFYEDDEGGDDDSSENIIVDPAYVFTVYAVGMTPFAHYIYETDEDGHIVFSNYGCITSLTCMGKTYTDGALIEFLREFVPTLENMDGLSYKWYEHHTGDEDWTELPEFKFTVSGGKIYKDGDESFDLDTFINEEWDHGVHEIAQAAKEMGSGTYTSEVSLKFDTIWNEVEGYDIVTKNVYVLDPSIFDDDDSDDDEDDEGNVDDSDPSSTTYMVYFIYGGYKLSYESINYVPGTPYVPTSELDMKGDIYRSYKVIMDEKEYKVGEGLFLTADVYVYVEYVEEPINPDEGDQSAEEGITLYFLGDYLVYANMPNFPRIVSVQVDDGPVYTGSEMANVLKSPMHIDKTLTWGVCSDWSMADVPGGIYHSIIYLKDDGTYGYRQDTGNTSDSVFETLEEAMASNGLMTVDVAKMVFSEFGEGVESKGTYTWGGESFTVDVLIINPAESDLIGPAEKPSEMELVLDVDSSLKYDIYDTDGISNESLYILVLEVTDDLYTVVMTPDLSDPFEEGMVFENLTCEEVLNAYNLFVPTFMGPLFSDETLVITDPYDYEDEQYSHVVKWNNEALADTGRMMYVEAIIADGLLIDLKFHDSTGGMKLVFAEFIKDIHEIMTDDENGPPVPDVQDDSVIYTYLDAINKESIYFEYATETVDSSTGTSYSNYAIEERDGEFVVVRGSKILTYGEFIDAYLRFKGLVPYSQGMYSYCESEMSRDAISVDGYKIECDRYDIWCTMTTSKDVRDAHITLYVYGDLIVSSVKEYKWVDSDRTQLVNSEVCNLQPFF